VQRLRLVFGQRVHSELELDRAVERHVPAAEPHVHEVGVVRPPLPNRPPLEHRRPEPPGIRVEPRQGAPLQLACLRELIVALAQVARVAAGVGSCAQPHAAALGPPHREREAQHQDDHRGGDVEEDAVAEGDPEPEQPDAPDDREERLDHAELRRDRDGRRRPDARRVARDWRGPVARWSVEGRRFRHPGIRAVGYALPDPGKD
jgi:hypothetical protein